MLDPCHIIIDLSECAVHNLIDKKAIDHFLVTAVAKMKMTPIGLPDIVQFQGKEAIECGITASQVLAESLISIHTYPEMNMCYIDLFSCKHFDALLLYDYCREYFKADSGTMDRVKRMSVLDQRIRGGNHSTHFTDIYF